MEGPIDSGPNRRTEIIGASVTLLVLPTIAVILRFLSRWIARAGLWWDDLAIFLGMVFAWGTNITTLLQMEFGGMGRHRLDLPESTLVIWFKYLYVFELMYTLAQTANKFAITLFLYRIFPVVQFRHFLYYIKAFVFSFITACIITCIFQCSPVDAFWTHLAGALPGAHCINAHLYIILAGSINTVTDFVLLALPIPLLWRLRTSTSQKLLLTGIFILGLTVCAVSIVRLVTLSELTNSDITWNYVTPSIWTAAESSITVVSACLPSLRPLFARVIWRGFSRVEVKPQPSQRSLAASWRSGKLKDNYDGSFNRLPDWTNISAVHEGNSNESEEYEIGDTRPNAPLKGIVVNTTIVQEIHERLNYHNELF